MPKCIFVVSIGLFIAAAPAVSAQRGPYDCTAVDADTLASVVGTGSPTAFGRTLRGGADQDGHVGFDTTAMIGRVTLDNWFSREGAEIISAGALGRPLLID